MTVVNGYCTLEELRSQLGDSGNRLAVDLLERAVSATSRAVDAWCHRRFWQDATTTARTIPAGDVTPDLVWVPDISTIEGLVVQTDPGTAGTWSTTWAVGDYQVEPLGADADGGAYAWWRIAAVGDHRFPTGQDRRSRVRVTARWGWSAVPDGVVEATILKATALFLRKDSPHGVAGFGSEGYAVRITRKDADVCELLAPYVRVDVRGV